MKIALVYDRVNKFGGAEKVLLALHQIWPQAPLYTAVYNKKSTLWAKDFTVHSSFLQHFPLAKTHHELYSLLTPIAFESFNFNQYDVVISVTSAEAKSIISKPTTLHLCYCLTPTRYLWSHHHQYLASPGLGIFNSFGKKVFKLTSHYQQNLDIITASRPDKYIAISSVTKKRIKKYYHQEASIIFPPVNTKLFYNKPSKDYFLLVSRLVPYKNIDLAIKAFNQLKEKLIIVGTGRQLTSLKRISGSTIKFLGLVEEKRLSSLYSQAQALIMPQEEDFGIVSLEAQSSGKPVIAFARGGALDTVINNQTGIIFNHPTVDSLIKAVKQFRSRSWDYQKIQSHARKFDQLQFKKTFQSKLEEQWLKKQT